MMTILMRIALLGLILSLTSCVAYKDNKGDWTSDWLFGNGVVTRTVDSEGKPTIRQNPRVDLIRVRFTVEAMPSIVEKCAEWPLATACITDKIYIQGTPQSATMLLNVQFVGWGDKPRLEDGTLYTYPYPTNSYEMGLVGDLLAQAMNLDIGLNRRTELGHEFMAHVAGLDHPFIFEWSVNEGLY